jgi:hypothetical protein
MHYTMKTYGEVEAYPHILTPTQDMSGQLHALAALPLGR